MKIFLFFLEGHKNAGSVQKNNRVGRVSGNTGIFRPYQHINPFP